MINIHVNTICIILLSFCIPNSCGVKNNNKKHNPTLNNLIKTEKKSISNTLKENNHLPVEDRVALYYKLKKEKPNKYNFDNEGELTMYGYSLLWDYLYKDAIAIFKLIVDQFPKSSNAYDSLGEGFLKIGNKEKALLNYQKSLELDPDNFNAEDQIYYINYPNKKQVKPTDKFNKVFTINEYKADLEQLGNRLIKVHPNIFKFINKNDFWNIIEDKKALITNHTTYGQFNWYCNEIIANINCSHTTSGGFYEESEMLPLALRFPLQTRLIDNQLFIIDPLNNNDRLDIKDEIISINGNKISDLISEIYKHIPSQGYIKTSKRHNFNTWSTGLIPYALNFPKSYEIIIKGKETPISLNTAQSFNNQFEDPSIQPCREGLCFELLDDKKSAIMTIASFNYYSWNNLSVFKKFIDNRFKILKQKNIENLVIDLRFNGGGSPESSVHLLKYLVKESFIYFSDSEYEATETKEIQYPSENAFRGKLYFIIDGNGNSTTGHFMSMVKTLKLGVIVGEELGSNQFCTGGQKSCRLSNTKFNYSVANNTNETSATMLPDEIGILPNHYVTQSIDDYLNKFDFVKNYTIKLIDDSLAFNTKSLDLLEIDSTWGKEYYNFPLYFAKEINYEGTEEVVFPAFWINKDSSDFWSYVVAWKINLASELPNNELENKMEIYFDGLMNVVNEDKEIVIPKTKANFSITSNNNDTCNYVGNVTIFDAFATKKTLTLNVQIDKYYCNQQKKSILIFRFSPKEFEHKIWHKLREVKLRSSVCDF